MPPLTYIHASEAARTTAGGRAADAMQKVCKTIGLLFFAMLALTGCTGNGGTKHVPQDNDTLYTEQKAMNIHRTEP